MIAATLLTGCEGQTMELATAQIILRSPSGEAITETERPPTAKELEHLKPSDEAVRQVTRRFEEFGFKVEGGGVSGLTISGDHAVFERVFQTKLTAVVGPDGRTRGWKAQSPIIVDEDLRQWIADVVLSIMPEYVR